MIQLEGHIWGRNTQQSAINDVLIGRINLLTVPMIFRMAVTTGRQITAAIQGRMRIGLGATGMVADGTSVCWKTVVCTTPATNLVNRPFSRVGFSKVNLW